MLYSLDEIIANGEAYFFYKKEDVKNKEYKISLVYDKLDKDTIYIPVKVICSFKLSDDFVLYLENAIKNKKIRGFVFDEIRYSDEQYRNLLFKIIEKYKDDIDFILMTDDTEKMAERLCYYTRVAKFSDKMRLLAVTGSVGKTTTTEMLCSVLKQKYKIYRGAATVNMKIKILNKFFEADSDTDFLVLETAMQRKGYLKFYSELYNADGIIITNATTENIKDFGSTDNIAKEKSTLSSYLNEKAVVVAENNPSFEYHLRKTKAKKILLDKNGYELISADKNGSKFNYKNFEYEIPVVGLHQITNAIKAIELLLQLGFEPSFIKSGLQELEAVGDRWVVDKYEGGIEFITDCPNNPSVETMLANIETFLNLYKDEKIKRVAISRIKFLGDLEEKFYLKIAKFLAKSDLNEVIVLDIEAKSIYEYLKNNSDIKTTFFEKPESLTKDTPFVKYLIDTLNEKQAFLLKAQRDDYGIKFGQVKEILRKELKFMG